MNSFLYDMSTIPNYLFTILYISPYIIMLILNHDNSNEMTSKVFLVYFIITLFLIGPDI